MSSKYFENFPVISYNGRAARNLLVKTSFYKDVLSNYQAFYPYTVQSDDTPSTLAFHYYGDIKLDWLVYMSNQIINPYFEWILNDDQFQDYLIKKYGSMEKALTTAHHFVYNDTVDPDDEEAEYKKTYWMERSTFNFLTPVEKSFWKPVYCYNYEYELNESRRNILLLDKSLLPQVLKEISEIFNRA